MKDKINSTKSAPLYNSYFLEITLGFSGVLICSDKCLTQLRRLAKNSGFIYHKIVKLTLSHNKFVVKIIFLHIFVFIKHPSTDAINNCLIYVLRDDNHNISLSWSCVV